MDSSLKLSLMILAMGAVGLLYALYALTRTHQGIFLTRYGHNRPFSGTPRQVRSNKRVQGGTSVFILVLSLTFIIFSLQSLASTHGVLATCVIQGMHFEQHSRGPSNWNLYTSCGHIVSYGDERPDMMTGGTYRILEVESSSLFGNNPPSLDQYTQVG